MKKLIAVLALAFVATTTTVRADSGPLLALLTENGVVDTLATGNDTPTQLAQSRGVISRTFYDMRCSSACTIMRDIAAARCRSGDRTGRCWCNERRSSSGRVVTKAHKICP